MKDTWEEYIARKGVDDAQCFACGVLPTGADDRPQAASYDRRETAGESRKDVRKRYDTSGKRRFQLCTSIGATGFEPATSCSQSRRPGAVSACEQRTCSGGDGGCCTQRCTDNSDDPRLARIRVSWSSLPDHIKTTIETIVQVVSNTDSD